MVSFARRTLATVVIVTGVVAFSTLVAPKLFGWSSMVVTSGSMAPTFDAGSVVLITPVEASEVSEGDIVTFRDPDGYTTHRVVGLESSWVEGEAKQSFATKGDANEENDPTPLDPRNIVGKAKFAVPYVGYAVNFAKTPAGAGALAALVLLVLFTGGESKRASQHKKVSEPAVTS